MVKLRKLSVWAGAIVALGFCAEARADFLVQVTSTAVLPAPPGVTTSGLSTVTVTSLLDSPSDLTLANAPSQATSQDFGTTSVATTRVQGDNASDPFNIPINFSLVLSGSGAGNGDPGNTATLHVIGTLVGGIGFDDDTLTYTNGATSDLHDPTGSPASSIYTFVNVDGVNIGVALTAYTPPGSPPGTTNDFAVYLFNASVPEPSTMALLGVGGLLLAAPRLRRRVRRLGEAK